MHPGRVTINTNWLGLLLFLAVTFALLATTIEVTSAGKELRQEKTEHHGFIQLLEGISAQQGMILQQLYGTDFVDKPEEFDPERTMAGVTLTVVLRLEASGSENLAIIQVDDTGTRRHKLMRNVPQELKVGDSVSGKRVVYEINGQMQFHQQN